MERALGDALRLYDAAIIGTEQYSAAPLESNSVYEALMQCRMDGLREEMKLAAGRPTAAIAGQYEWVKDADFERQLEGYLQADDYYKDPSADSLAQAVIPALHRWLEVRREREARFDGETRAAFGNETQRMRYALLRLLMNGMSYDEPVDSLCYTFRIASSSTLTEKKDTIPTFTTRAATCISQARHGVTRLCWSMTGTRFFVLILMPTS